MKQEGHYNVIEHAFKKEDDTFRQILKDANDFADEWDAVGKTPGYYFYHNYYNISFLSRKNKDEIKNEIFLTRVPLKGKPYSETYGNDMLPSTRSAKEFYTTINDSVIGYNYGNQSDNLSFLHAMREKGESIEKAENKFKEHLKTCFFEYLFRLDYKESLFILGIALHGITDSFTPSHSGFQSFSLQCEKYEADFKLIHPAFVAGDYLKGTNMGTWHTPGDIVPFTKKQGEKHIEEKEQAWWYKFSNNKKEINKNLYVFSDTAIKTLQDIYTKLKSMKDAGGKNVDDVVKIWEDNYTQFRNTLTGYGKAETGHEFRKLIDERTYTTTDGYKFLTQR